MNKTIEEAAKEAVRKEYFCESCAYKNDCDLCGGENTAFDCCECPADSYEDGFKAGANHVYGLPLSQRLTAEEKEWVRKEYANTYPNDIDCGVENMLIQGVLERIFGADFFQGVNEEARTLRIALARRIVA